MVVAHRYFPMISQQGGRRSVGSCVAKYIDHARVSPRRPQWDRRKAGPHPQLPLLARRIALLAAIVAAFLGLGAIGLALAEGVGAWYAFRWALDTAATVGGFLSRTPSWGSSFTSC